MTKGTRAKEIPILTSTHATPLPTAPSGLAKTTQVSTSDGSKALQVQIA